MTEIDAMRRALKLALGGWGRVAPNPLVGALLIRDGRVIGEGYHTAYGESHAELNALAVCPDARGATCVVSLEPCAHHGKTPPCVSALIQAGVKRVVAAVPDPSKDAGGGAAKLRAAGIEVEFGLLQDEAAALNAPFLWSERLASRPFVAVKVATSLDGFMADAAGRAKWVSGVESRDYTHWLRAGYDAIAVGRKTAESDDPQLTVRGAVPPRVPPTRVVFTRGGLKTDLYLVRTAKEVPTIVITDPASKPQTEKAFRGTGVDLIPGTGRSDALAALRQRGVRSILVEGGGTLITALMADNLVDRIYWMQAPIFLGSGTRAFGDRAPTLLGDAKHWAVTDRQAMGKDTLLVVDRELCLPGS